MVGRSPSSRDVHTLTTHSEHTCKPRSQTNIYLLVGMTDRCEVGTVLRYKTRFRMVFGDGTPCFSRLACILAHIISFISFVRHTIRVSCRWQVKQLREPLSRDNWLGRWKTTVEMTRIYWRKRTERMEDFAQRGRPDDRNLNVRFLKRLEFYSLVINLRIGLGFRISESHLIL